MSSSSNESDLVTRLFSLERELETLKEDVETAVSYIVSPTERFVCDVNAEWCYATVFLHDDHDVTLDSSQLEAFRALGFKQIDFVRKSYQSVKL